MSVRIKGQYRVAHVVFNECKTFATCCVVTVKMGLLPKNCVERGVVMRSNNVSANVVNQLLLVFL